MKRNWDLILFCLIHLFLFISLITGVKYFMLDLPTNMYINEAYGLWGIFYLPQGTGRYWPLAPFVNALVTEIFGNDIFWQWIIHYGLFFCMTVLVWRASYMCIKDRKKSFFSFLVCVCVTPMAENVFTLGKPEILLCVMILCSIILIEGVLLSNKKNKIGYFVGLALTFFLSYLCKETSIILIPMVLLLCIYCFAWDKENRNKALIVLAECVITFGAYYIIKRTINSVYGIEKSAYISFQITWGNIFSCAIYYIKYCWDIFIFGLLALGCSLYLFVSDKRNNRAFYLIMNICGWGYIFGICLWQFNIVYYIYPSVLFFAISLVCVLEILDKRKMIILISIPLIYGSWNGYIISSSTIDTSVAFSESMDFVLNDNRIKGKMYVANYTLYDEPPYQMNLLFKVLRKPLMVYGIKDINVGVDTRTLDLYGLTEEAYIEKIKEVDIKEGDYILFLDIVRNNWVPSRGVNPINQIDDINSVCDGLMAVEVAGREHQRKRITYLGMKDELSGWHIYQIIGNKKDISVETEWADWMGKDNTQLNITCDNEKYVIVEGMYDVGVDEIDVECRSGERVFPSILYLDKEKNVYRLEIDIRGYGDDDKKIQLVFTNSFVPSETIDGSEDNRVLTLRYPTNVYLTNTLNYEEK